VIKSGTRGVEHAANIGERNKYTGLAGTPVGKRPLGRPLNGWKDIKMDLKSGRHGLD
jgi:hypothetical protein